MDFSGAEVLARWGYSEVLDGTFAAMYNGPDADALRNKRRNTTPFEALTDDDKYSLAFQAANIRVKLILYLAGVERFALVDVDRTILGRLIVPPNVWRDSQGNFYPFAHYITTSTNEAGDARAIVIDPKDYRSPDDPITIGRSYQHPILIDGYHRAAAFWKCGPRDGSIPAYFPRGLVI